MVKKFTDCIFACSLAAFASAAMAQETELSATRVLDDSVPKAPNTEHSSLPPTVVASDGKRIIDPEVASQTFVLKEVNFAGSSIYARADFESLWRGSIGQSLSIGELDLIVAEVQRLIRSDGYVFTRVAGRASADGVVDIRVVEAVVGSVSVEESAAPVGPVIEQLRRLAKKLEDGPPNLHISRVERVLLLMNDVPGVSRATAIPRPDRSAGPGVINFVINVERKPISGVVFVDNRQAPSTGHGLAGGVIEYGSFGSRGDTLELTVLNSFGEKFDDLSERHVGQLAYQANLGSDGLVLKGRGLASMTKPGANLDALDIDGLQFEAQVGLEYPFVRSRAMSLWGEVSLNVLEADTTALGGAQQLNGDSVRVAEIAFNGLVRDSYGFTFGQIGVRQGLELFGSSRTGDADLSRADAELDATVIQADITREQNLNDQFSAMFRISGQYASAPLVSSEEFTIGGTSFGRGFDPGEFSGDIGYGLSAELRFNVPQSAFSGLEADGFGIQLYSWYDYGWVDNLQGGAPSSENISSVGGGLRFSLPSDVSGEIEFAQPLKVLQRTADDDWRVFFGLRKRF